MIHGRVYAIRSHQTNKIYIGSTTQKLCVRMCGHRRDYKCYLDGKTNYVTSFEIVQYEHYIELLFEGDFESKDELRKKEGEYIRGMECVNRCVAGRTKQEYYNENRAKVIEKTKKYYSDNKESISEYMKEYQKANAVTISEKKKQRYEENQTAIQEKRKQTNTCECGSICRRSDKSAHERTKKHQTFINK